MSACELPCVQADKVVQLYETMLTRHTVMVVGPTGGGKSVVINTLAQSQTKCVPKPNHIYRAAIAHVYMYNYSKPANKQKSSIY